MKCLGKHKIKIRVTSVKGITEGEEPQNFTFNLDVPDEYLPFTYEFSNSMIIMIGIIIILSFVIWRRRRKKKKMSKIELKNLL